MELVIIPSFNDVFPDEEIPKLEDLLKGISSTIVINTLSWINAELHVDPLDFQIQLHILKAFIERSSKEIRDQIHNNINKLSEKHKQIEMSLFPLITSLLFIEYELLNYRIGEFGDIAPEDEINIFKAFLIFNQKIDKEHGDKIIAIGKLSKDSLSDEYFYRASWPIFIDQYEHTLSKSILIQCYLSFDFLDYLEKNEKYNPFVRNYLKRAKVPIYQEYIKKLLVFYIDSYKSGSGRFTARFSPEYLENNAVLEEFIMEPWNMSAEDYRAMNKHVNFLGMREKPIIRFEDGYLAVTNWKYLVDKLYQAFIFDFYHNSGIDPMVISFNEYKSDLGHGFAQMGIFERFLDNSFSNSDGLCLKDQNELINFDYYCRIGNKIILIEFKDIILKYSKEYEELKKDIDKKLIQEKHNNKIKKKGITQLIEHIEKINEHYKEIDDFGLEEIDKEEIIIYPVIVYTHKALGMPGINDYLAERFVQLNKGKHHGFFMVRELVMIDFELFINYYDPFKSGQLNLIDLIENYLNTLAYLRTAARYSNTTDGQINKFQTFEEVSSKFTIQFSDFYKSSLYQELRKRLFPDEV